ncbi:MAG TPA: hypothetical protein VFV50_16725 [Bdellovibrionales bacterium]|nr:hypothetical protein [Bdellovibrionales bacterium]
MVLSELRAAIVLLDGNVTKFFEKLTQRKIWMRVRKQALHAIDLGLQRSRPGESILGVLG